MFSLLPVGDLKGGEAILVFLVRVLMTVISTPVQSISALSKLSAMFLVALEVPVAIVSRELLSS